jgi:hypothetical protein
MKPLPTTFRSDGFDFQLLLREGDVALLRKTKPGFSFETYEVVILHRTKEHIGPRGNLILASECMPHDERWGTRGWTYSDRVLADRKFYQLERRASAFAPAFRCPDPQTKSKALWRKTVHQEMGPSGISVGFLPG